MSSTNKSKVDRVLSIPSIFGITAGQTDLAYLIELMDLGNYLRNIPYSWDIATRRNSTFFARKYSTFLTWVE